MRAGVGARVVMLVDNNVRADSRVQKAARSAAEAGFDVTLIGVAPNGVDETWHLGPATVRVLAMPTILARRPHEFRRAWLRWPLAYPPTGVAERNAAWVKAAQADLELRAAEVDRTDRLERRRIAVREQYLRALARWVRLRTRMLRRARSGRKLRGPWDRAYTLFWQTYLGDRSWRRLEPGLWDYELACAGTIDELEPDLIHANDFRMLGVGARAVRRARARGRSVRLVWDAHEFLPGLHPWTDNARWLPANVAHEREYAPHADAVVTISDELADLLREEHHLPRRPIVVANAPTIAGVDPDAPALSDLRADCGIGADTPLLAYCGGITRVRGLDTLIEALPRLPALHVALVSVAPGRQTYGHATKLLARATALGIADRVHLLPYVPHAQVPAYLSVADVAFSGLSHLPNHEIALPNKFFEYAHARLPIVVSDVRTMAATVTETGQGEIFRAGDVGELVRALRAVLDEPKRYRAAYDKPGLLESWTWETQVKGLLRLYDELLSTPPQAASASE